MPKKVKTKKRRVKYGIEENGYLWNIMYPEKKWALDVCRNKAGRKVVKFVECRS